MKRGQELELVVEKFADRGKSLTRVDGYVVFIRDAVPGDRVKVQLSPYDLSKGRIVYRYK